MDKSMSGVRAKLEALSRKKKRGGKSQTGPSKTMDAQKLKTMSK